MGKGASKIPEAGDFPVGLDSALFEQLPEEVKTKVIEQYTEYKSQYDDLQSSYDRLRVDSGTFVVGALTPLIWTFSCLR